MASALDAVQVGTVRVLAASRVQAIAVIANAVRGRNAAVFGFCNAHTVVTAEHQPDFRAALASITLFNDGVGVDLARRLLSGSRFPANLNGTDLTPDLLAALPSPSRVFLLGSPPAVAEEAGRRLAERFANVEIVGCQDGFFPDEASPRIVETIAQRRTDLLLVGIGHPRQELWAARWGQETGAAVLCVGAFLDFTAGRITRAPDWVRKLRSEWVYRLLSEPRRLGERYLIGNVRFFGIVVRQRMRGGAGSQRSD